MFSLSDPYRLRQFTELLILTVGIGYGVSRLYGRLAGVAVAWLLFSGLRVFAAPVSPYSIGYWITVFDGAARESLAFFFMAVIPACLLSVTLLTRFFQGFALLNAAAIFAGLFWSGPIGLLFNASMSGCFQVALIPLFFLRRQNWYLAAPVVASVFATQQSQPVALLFLFAALVLIYRKDWKCLAVAAVSFVPAVWFFAGKSAAFNSSGRVTLWQLAFDFWKMYVNPWIGMGAGGYEISGPRISKTLTGMEYHWLHSEWLQIGFEQGLVGLALAVAVYAAALYRMRTAPLTFLSLAVMGAFGIANMPLRYPLVACFAAMLIRVAFQRHASAIATRARENSKA